MDYGTCKAIEMSFACMQAEMLFAMWSAAMTQGEAVRIAAFSSALQIVSSPQGPASARPPTGACMNLLQLEYAKSASADIFPGLM